MSKKKIIKKVINRLIESQGLEITRKYELDYLLDKYNESLDFVDSSVKTFIFKNLKDNSQRKRFLKQLYGTSIGEAYYLLSYLQQSLKLSGDICEFGCANGATSALIANEILDTQRGLWLYDSFTGLSKPTNKDELINDIFSLGSMDKYEGTMSYSIEEVTDRLKQVPFPKKRIHIVKGFIEKTIKMSPQPQKVCFAYIDFDLYEPISVALKFLDKKLTKGGFILVDDYNFFSKGAKVAVDEFMEKNKEKYTFLLPHYFAGHFCLIQKK